MRDLIIRGNDDVMDAYDAFNLIGDDGDFVFDENGDEILDKELMNKDTIEIFNECDDWNPNTTLATADFLMAHDIDVSDVKPILLGIIDFEMMDEIIGKYKIPEERKEELLKFKLEVQKLKDTNRLSDQTIKDALNEIKIKIIPETTGYESVIKQIKKEYPEQTIVCYWIQEWNKREEVYSKIVDGWNETKEGKSVIKYMQNGTLAIKWFGYATDRIDGETLGTCDMLGPDSKYIYPEKFERYIEKYSVKPWSKQFIVDCLEWSNENEN